MNSRGHRGEELKAGCDDFLALAQPSASAHQHISVVKGVDTLHNGWARECQRKDQTLCACVSVCECVCVCV